MITKRKAALEGLTGGRSLEPQTSVSLAVERRALPDGNEAVLYAMWHVPPDGRPCQSEGAVVTVAAPGFDLTRHAAELPRAVLTSSELPPGPVMTLNLGGLLGDESMGRGDRLELVLAHLEPWDARVPAKYVGSLQHEVRKRLGRNPVDDAEAADLQSTILADPDFTEAAEPTGLPHTLPMDPKLPLADLQAYVALAAIRAEYHESEAWRFLGPYVSRVVRGPSWLTSDERKNIAADVVTHAVRRWYQPQSSGSLRGYLRLVARGIASEDGPPAPELVSGNMDQYGSMDRQLAAVEGEQTVMEDEEVVRAGPPVHLSNLPKYRTVRQAAAEARIPVRTAYYAIQLGKVDSLSEGRSIRLDQRGVNQLRALTAQRDEKKALVTAVQAEQPCSWDAARMRVNRRLKSGKSKREIMNELQKGRKRAKN